MSTLDVVAEVLREVAPRALKAREIAELARGRLPTESRTPETVVSRDLAIDVRDRGASSRFLRVGRGEFVLKEALPSALYNDVEPYAAQWTRNLISAGELTPGVVDERSIRDLKPADVAGYRQFHAFSGIGIWSRALRDAGWPDDANIWSGSCPCQSFSQAGQKRGFDDERHLWPEWFRLIAACRPALVLGEQVSSKDGLAWLDVVLADLEGANYAVRTIDTCAAGIGAAHLRQRFYFVAIARERGREVLSASWLHDRGQPRNDAARRRSVDGGTSVALSDAASARREAAQDDGADRGDAHPRSETGEWRATWDLEPQRGGADDGASALSDAECVLRHDGRTPFAHGRSEVESDRHGEVDGTGGDGSLSGELGDAGRDGAREHGRELPGDEAQHEERSTPGDHSSVLAGTADSGNAGSSWDGAVKGFWAHANWVYCRPAPGHQNGCFRAVEPVLIKMAPGTPTPVGPLRPEEIDDVHSAETDATQILRGLWSEDGAQAFQRWFGKFERVQAAEVLRSALHGRRDGRENQSSKCAELAAAEREAGEEILFPLRSFGQEACRAPRGRESTQQQPLQPEDLVRLVSSSLAFAKFRSDDRTAEALQTLLETCNAGRLVLGPSYKAAAFWRSLTDQDKGRLLVGLGGFRRASISPLVKEGSISNRAKRLRGFGNALVLPLAALFVDATIEALIDDRDRLAAPLESAT